MHNHKSVKKASLLILTLVFALILCGATSAADNNVALNTTHNGTVSGDLYVNATQPVAFADQPSSGVTSREFNQTFDLPTNSSANGTDIQWAEVYVNIYSGSGSNNWPLNATILLDGDGDGIYETTLGTELLTSENYSTDGTIFWINDHCFRVYSDYQLWYDVTGLITCTNPSIYVKTEQVESDPYDGRLKMITLVAAYNDGDDDVVNYWVNDGQDWISSGKTSSTSFDTSTVDGTIESATLTTVTLSSKDGTYTFNDTTYDGTDPVAPVNYFITHTWDVTSQITSANDSTLNYTAGSSSFKIVLATLTVREEVTATETGLANSAWPRSGQNNQNTGQSLYDGPSTSDLIWTYSTGTIAGTPAIGADGTIYAGSSNGNLYALNPNGTVKWTYNIGMIQGSPAIGADGTIYIGSYMGTLYALNSDGTLKWSYYTSAMIYNACPSIADDGTIYLTTFSGVVHALNSDGTVKWTYSIGSIIYGSTTLGTDGTIYVGGGKLYALDPDGALLWSYSVANGIYGSPAVGADGTIYTVDASGAVYALNANGTVEWTYSTGDTIWSSPAIATDGTIYITGYSGLLHALNSDGTLKWTYDTGSSIIMNGATIGADGTIYIGSRDNNIYAINPDGTLQWTYTTGDTIQPVGAAIGSNGTLYIGGSDGKLYAFKGVLAAFSADVVSGYSPLMVSFTNESTGNIESYQWDFDGDGIIDSDMENPSYLYTSPGVYTVTLTATGPLKTDETTTTITVNAAIESEADFTSDVTNGYTPLTVNFTNLSTGTIDTYQWDFNNDGTIDSEEENPTYTYDTAGSYTVKLRVSGAGGTSTIIKTGYITVTDDTEPPTVTATPEGGDLTTPIQATITATDNFDTNPVIYYTLDGTDPTTTSTQYTEPINITQTTTLKFIAVDGDNNISTIGTETYTDTQAPSVSADLESGEYTVAKQVTLTVTDTVDFNPTIYYTTDGTDPTTSNTVYTDPLDITQTTTLKFIGVDSSGNTSSVETRTYTIIDTESPDVTATLNENVVTLTATDNIDPNPNIYYTLDGTDPTTSSTQYTEPINLPINTTTTLKFIAVDKKGNTSPISSETYIINDTEAPVVDANRSGDTITLSATDNMDTSPDIYYTTDGTDPTTDSTPYTEPITLPENSTTSISFIGVDSSGNTSLVKRRTYVTSTSGDLCQGGRFSSGEDKVNNTIYAEGNIGVRVLEYGGYHWFDGTGTATFTASQLNIPENATLISARLYQARTWYGVPNYTVVFNGYAIDEYTGYYIDYCSGQNSFDVTEYINLYGDNTAVITGGNVPYAAILVVIYECDSEPYRQIWLNEGADCLLYGTTDPYVAYTMLDNATTNGIISAEVTTVLLSGDQVNVPIYFNGQTINMSSAGGSDPSIHYYDVTSALQDGTNELGVHTNSNDDYFNFAIAVLEVTKDLTAPTVSANIGTGVFGDSQTVTLTAEDNVDTCPEIYYTLDGTVPTTSSLLYSDPIVIDATTMLKFIAVDDMGNISQVQSKTYTIDTTAPTTSINLTSGTYNTALSVVLSAEDNIDANPTIYYTTDGTTPTSSSTQYIEPIIIDSTTTLQFIAVDILGNTSPVQTETYTINLDTTAPNVTANPTGGLFNTTKKVTLTATDNIDTNPEIYYTTDGTTPTTNSTLYTDPISIDATTVLSFIAVDDAGNVSDVQTETYTINTDTTAPTIVTVDPNNGTTSLAGDENFTITFSEDIIEGTGWIELVDSSGTAIPFIMTINGNVLTIDPISDLTESKYKLMIHTGSVTDLAGNMLAGKSFRFSVGSAPTITATTPADGETNVHVAKTIAVTFSEAIRKSKYFWVELVNSTGTAIAYTSYITSGNMLVINPTSDLAANTTYKIKIHTGSVTDLAGNYLAAKIISFTTR